MAREAVGDTAAVRLQWRALGSDVNVRSDTTSIYEVDPGIGSRERGEWEPRSGPEKTRVARRTGAGGKDAHAANDMTPASIWQRQTNPVISFGAKPPCWLIQAAGVVKRLVAYGFLGSPSSGRRSRSSR